MFRVQELHHVTDHLPSSPAHASGTACLLAFVTRHCPQEHLQHCWKLILVWLMAAAPVFLNWRLRNVYRVTNKLCKLIFCQQFVKFRPIVKTFGTKIAKMASFSEAYSFSTSPNFCQRTTVLNADVPNCYITM